MSQGQICKLCGCVTKLQNSHIYPEFLYKFCYDAKHRAIKFNTQEISRIIVQKGYREPLLCVKCEQHLSEIERRFKIDWYDRSRLPVQFENECWRLEGFDYTSFKLFHLSVLWRCSVSKSKAFATVSLGPHEKRIAQLIQNADAGEEFEYSIVSQLLVHNDCIVHSLVSPPIRLKLDGLHVYLMVYGGCEWFLYVSKHNRTDVKELGFRKDGSLILIRQSFLESHTARSMDAELQTKAGQNFVQVYKKLRKKHECLFSENRNS